MLTCLFDERAKHIYGEDFIVYNVHGLTHLAADVKWHGCVDLFSGFAYENKVQDLKRRVREGSCPLAQIIRRLSKERAAFSELGAVDDDDDDDVQWFNVHLKAD